MDPFTIMALMGVAYPVAKKIGDAVTTSDQERDIAGLKAQPGMEPSEVEATRRAYHFPQRKSSMEAQQKGESFLAATGMGSGRTLEGIQETRFREDAAAQEKTAGIIEKAKLDTRQYKEARLAALEAAEAKGEAADTTAIVNAATTVAMAYGQKAAAEKDHAAFGDALTEMGITDPKDKAALALMNKNGTLGDFFAGPGGAALVAKYEGVAAPAAPAAPAYPALADVQSLNRMPMTPSGVDTDPYAGMTQEQIAATKAFYEGH